MSNRKRLFVTGDCHGDFRRFSKKQCSKSPLKISDSDYVIVCGDLGLIWHKDKTFEYNLDCLSRLPFALLWVQGNHENYDMIAEYPVEMWNGGKVRHIIRNKIILLERGQVFTIAGHTLFTFGGASSHDVQGGILDEEDPHYEVLRMEAIKAGLSYRVIGKTWWYQELPSKVEMQEGIANLEKTDYQVDYVISHCASNSTQDKLDMHCTGLGFPTNIYSTDVLTDYFEGLEQKLQYKHWFCGHYHVNACIDDKHTILYEKISP